MFFRTFSYFKFLLKSQNQHGLHSPFVYDFITKGMYQQKIKKDALLDYNELKFLSKKQIIILTKIVNYFKVDKIHYDSNSFLENSNTSYKLLLINNLSSLKKINFKDLNSNHILIVDKIHQHKKEWQEILGTKEATVTIDLFYFGLVFFRNKQAKEHFIIRV